MAFILSSTLHSAAALEDTINPRGHYALNNLTMSDSGLNEPSYDVQVILSDLQDTDNPLSSAKTFQDLNL